MSAHTNTDDPPQIEVRLFGGPIVLVEGKAIRLSKYQSYLVALVFGHGDDGISRSRAIDFLWDEPDGVEQRHRLSQLLYGVNRKVAPARIMRDEGSNFIHPSGVCDLNQLESAVHGVEVGRIRSITAAPFLRQIRTEPTPKFGHWVAGRETSLKMKLSRVATSAWSGATLRGHWEDATSAAEILLTLSPSDEGALRRLVRSLVLQGKREKAYQHAEEFRAERLLHTDRWQLSASTRNLLDCSEPEPLTNLDTNEARRRWHTRLIGREEPLESLHLWLQSDVPSGIRTAIIQGDAGVGKSRLIQEALRSLRMDGNLILTSVSAELEQQIPLNCWIDALAHPEVENLLRTLEEPWRGVLSQFLTPAYQRDEGGNADEYIRPGSIPRRTYEALRFLLQALSQDSELVFFFDDFHWADDTSVAALDFIRRRWRGSSCTVIIALRQEQLYRHKSLLAFVKGVSADGGLVQVLGGLTPAFSAELAREASGGNISIEDAQLISNISGHNPFFIVEIASEIAAGRLRVDSTSLSPSLPLSVRQLLDARVTCLDESVVKVLEIICVYDRAIHIGRLAQLVGGGRDFLPDLVMILEQLTQHRLVTVDQGVVQVRHSLLRQGVYESLSDSRRAGIHLQVAELLAGDRNGDSIGEAALHYHEAGAVGQALTTSLAASHQAEDRGAMRESIRFLEIARENARSREAKTKIVSRLAHLQYLDHDLSAAAPLLAIVARQAQEAGDLKGGLSASVKRVDALSRLKTLSLADVAEELQNVRAQARMAELWEVAAQALDVEVRSRVREEDVEGIRRCLREAENFVESGPPQAQCLWLNILANHQNYGDPEKARESLFEARILARRHNLKHEHTLTLHRLIAVLLQQGTAGTPEGLEILSQALCAAKRSGDLDLKFRILANLGAWYIDIGEFEAARHTLEEAEGQVEGMEAPGPKIIINVNMGELEFWTQNFDTAIQRFRNAEALLDDTGRSRAFWMVRPGLGLSALMVGDLKEAHRQDDLVQGSPLAISFDPTLLTLFRARLLQTRGHVAEAIKLIEESAEEVRMRTPAVSLKLIIESMRMRVRNDQKGAERLGSQARRIAEELVLPRRANEIDRILAE